MKKESLTTVPRISRKWAIFSLVSLAIVATPLIFFATRKADAAPSVTAQQVADIQNYAGSTLKGLASTSTNPAKTSSATTPSAPVNTTWYFADGRVGQNFREYLTIENPYNTSCATTIKYDYTPDNASPANKSVSIIVNASSRLTESVNQDLGFPSTSGTAASVAAIVSVNTSATPNCKGLVVEQPVYFTNYHGISSGTDVLGTTHLSNAYTFSDVSSGQTGTSYLTIFNPGTTSATVLVGYYAGGKVIAAQMITVQANTRGTLSPSAITLPAHVAAIVASSIPVLAERATYFTNIGAGANTVLGAYETVGATGLGQDWLFSEGYTGSNTQEYLTLANFNPNNISSSVTITLKSKTGVTHSFPVTIGAQSQYIFNVNANNTFAGSSPEVSAEVTVSTGTAMIAAQREMFFSYKHTSANGQVTTALGGTDVVGQMGPASHNAYAFAEGYANTGYSDWLTMQNPTANPETITITVVNGLGQSYSQNVTVPANARFTEDLASLVQTVFHSGTDSNANAFSTTVTTANGAVFAAERPMYFNTNGVSTFAAQGGSDIFGYTGG